MAEIDRSEKADAARFRWLINGNGYFMEEQGICGPWSNSQEDKDEARKIIDEWIAEEKTIDE